jgi:hypothetical protein
MKGTVEIMLNHTIHRTVRTVRAARAVIARPPYAIPGHFYSPLTSRDDVEQALKGAPMVSVDMREEAQLSLAARLQPILSQPPPGPRYTVRNRMFGPADTAVYRAMLHHLRPRQIIEVGSGYSTAVVLDEAEVGGIPDVAMTCIDPFPEVLQQMLRQGDARRISIVAQPVQRVPLDQYRRLAAGDVLFIDSSHVAKAGSDVIWLMLHVMPALDQGVVVHLHDVFWPFEYPAGWLRQHRDWNESYLLHAFLIGNESWEILLFPSWLWRCHPDRVPQQIAAEQPGSIWLRKVR